MWLRTVRHFPLSSLLHRLRFKVSKALYRPAAVPSNLPEQWRAFWTADEANQSVLSPGFARWQYKIEDGERSKIQRSGQALLQGCQGEILNQPFTLPENVSALTWLLSEKTPLWRENYNYLEFLLPLAWLLDDFATPETEIQAAKTLLEQQLALFWQLTHRQRCWSTYGVSRRLLTYCEFLPILTQLSDYCQQEFWAQLVQDSQYLVAFLEWDVQGNHLIQNLTAWSAITVVFRQLPATQPMATQWQHQLKRLLSAVISRQVLSDGFHYERTPMYHLWVLRNVLEMIVWQQQSPEMIGVNEALQMFAQTMLQAGQAILHADGQIPLFGDASLPQVPNFKVLVDYAKTMAGLESISQESDAKVGFSSEPLKPFHYFDQAGFVVFRNMAPNAALIVDCGDFAPRDLPAHAHCDLGSFELHDAHGPLIVDTGVSEYVPSPLRDYCRGTAAHNTVWFPGQEQAEIWDGFRVAEYPRFHQCRVNQGKVESALNIERHAVENSSKSLSANESQLILSYENYNGAYRHERTVTHLGQRFWVIEDRVSVSKIPQEVPWSLLHLHPDCAVESQDNAAYWVDQRLLIIPFSANPSDPNKVEFSKHSPWRGNLNRYSAGFNLDRSGQILAQPLSVDTDFRNVSGWILIPGQPAQLVWQWKEDTLQLEFPEDGVRFTFRVLR